MLSTKRATSFVSKSIFSNVLCLSSQHSYTTLHPQIEYINSKKCPKAVGPYSQAVKAKGFIFISGCLGIIPETGEMVEGGTAQEAHQALINLKNILEASGSSLQSVVKTSVFLENIDDFKEINGVYSEFFKGDAKPARSCYAVNQLPRQAKFEIEAVAIEDSQSQIESRNEGETQEKDKV